MQVLRIFGCIRRCRLRDKDVGYSVFISSCQHTHRSFVQCEEAEMPPPFAPSGMQCLTRQVGHSLGLKTFTLLDQLGGCGHTIDGDDE
jgi:hypothetical protein